MEDDVTVKMRTRKGDKAKEKYERNGKYSAKGVRIKTKAIWGNNAKKQHHLKIKNADVDQ